VPGGRDSPLGINQRSAGVSKKEGKERGRGGKKRWGQVKEGDSNGEGEGVSQNQRLRERGIKRSEEKG